MNGVVELGSVTGDELGVAFRNQGTVTLCPIDVAGIRVEVYKAALGRCPLPSGVHARRYQPFTVAISPATNVTNQASLLYRTVVEPMPILGRGLITA